MLPLSDKLLSAELKVAEATYSQFGTILVRYIPALFCITPVLSMNSSNTKTWRDELELSVSRLQSPIMMIIAQSGPQLSSSVPTFWKHPSDMLSSVEIYH